MKRTALLLALLLIGGSAMAQRKMTSKTTVQTTHYTAKPSVWYLGAAYGIYDYHGTRTIEVENFWGNIQTVEANYSAEGGAYLLGMQGGWLYSLIGDINKPFSPYVGAEATIGVGGNYANFAVQAGANVGIMLGSPSFRFDLRIQPQLTYFSEAPYYYEYESDSYDYSINHYEENPLLLPNIALRAGVWISNFNIYAQYNNIFSFGLGWRF